MQANAAPLRVFDMYITVFSSACVWHVEGLLRLAEWCATCTYVQSAKSSRESHGLVRSCSVP